MKFEWSQQVLSSFLILNPSESLRTGSVAPKIPMDAIEPFCRAVTSKTYTPFSGGTKFRNGDTIMARITPCLENGKCAQVNCLNQDEVGFGSTEFIVFRNIEGVSDKNFIYYLARSDLIREPAIKSMVGSSGRQRVQIDVLKNLVLTLPPLPIQRRIAAILSSLDDKIELNNNINANLQQQARALFTSWFVDFEPWGGVMPNGWREGAISELGSIVGGGTPSKVHEEYYINHGIPWITPKDLSVDKFMFIERGQLDISEVGLRNSSATLMPRGTVLFSSRAPIGYIAIAKNDVTTNQGFKSVVPNENVGTAYVYYLLKNILPTIESMASGSTFKEVSGSIMKNVPALIPDADTLLRFSEVCNPLFTQQEILESENRRLAELRNALLPKLMSGELDVSDVDFSGASDA